MDPLYFAIGGFVIAIALFRREMLIEKQTFRIILGLSATFFIAGLVVHLTEAGKH